MQTHTPDNPDFLSYLRADQSERWQQGEQVRVQYYLERYPSIENDAEVLLELIFSEILHLLEHGERPRLEEYLNRFPQHADALRQSWSQLQMMHPQLWLDTGEASSTGNPEPTLLAPRPAKPPLSLPGLELYEQIGKGAMGVVYRARDLRLNQPRAIKFISSGPFAGVEARQRFRTEGQAIARLNHPGVVRIFAMGEHEAIPFICMEYLPGGTLRDRLGRGPLEAREAVDLVRQLALAVQHAHANRILHRDLKPGNVLLNSDGTPKISDFGLAKLLDADDDTTETGQVLGTPAYMAPEQAASRLEEIAEQTDVYALGVILYQCLTGKVPFKGGNRSETLAQVKTQLPSPFPPNLRTARLQELESVCAKCLEKQRAQRYASASALAVDLQNWLDGKPVGPRPKRGLRRVLHGMRRRPLILGFVALLLLAGLSGGLLAYLGHPERPRWRMEVQLRRRDTLELIGPTGGPKWYRWWVGEADGKVRLKDGVFSVHAWPLTCVELIRHTSGCTHYRLTADVLHIESKQTGGVGVCFAATSQRFVNQTVLSFIDVEFNDLQDARDEVNRLPPELRKLVKAPTMNTVALSSTFYLSDPPGWESSVAYAQPELFTPAGNSGTQGKWRTIVVEVSPTRVRVSWDGLLVADLTVAALEEQLARHLAIHKRNNPNDPVVPLLSPRVNLEGGIGLVLRNSFASFRNVRLEPLDADRK